MTARLAGGLFSGTKDPAGLGSIAHAPAGEGMYNLIQMPRKILPQFISICLRCLLFIPVLAWQAGLAPAADLDFFKGGDIAAMLREMPPAPKALTPLPALEPLAAQPLRNWTVMVYMSGKNDLVFSLRDDMNEMEEAGSTGNMNVVAQLGHMGTTDRPWPVSRVFVQKDQYPNYISSQALEKRDNADMGDWRELADFIKWSKTNFPARKYMLIISGHGSGWWAYGRPSAVKGISFDDQSGRHISTQGLRLALEQGGGVDVYASDACLMQMTEVAYEIRKSAKFIVGSEEAGPAFGYQYKDFLLKAASTPDPSPRELAAAAVEAYVRSYIDGTGAYHRDVTHSYLDASRLDGLIPLLDEWTAAAMKNKDKKAISRAIKEVKRFESSDYMDLVDFMSLAGGYARTPELRGASARLSGYLSDQVIGLNAVSGAANARAHGLSIWIPYAFKKTYEDLAFARDSRWDEFVATLVKHTYPN